MALLLDGLANGWISLLAILILWVETAALCFFSPWPWQRLRGLCANAISGTCLLAALGLALRGDSPIWILALLGASLVAHAADVLQRGRDQRRAFRRRIE